MTPVFTIRRVAGLMAGLLLSAAAGAQALDTIWTDPVESFVSDEMRLSAQYPADAPSGALVHFAVTVESRKEHGGAEVSFTLLDGAGTIIRENGHTVNLARGPNEVAFDLDTTGLAEGQYTAHVAVTYGKRPDVISLYVPVRRVTETGVKTTLASAQVRIEELDTRTNGADARIGLTREVALQAQADVNGAQWRQAVMRLDYLVGALDRVAAGLVFAGQAGPGSVAQAGQPLMLGARGFQSAPGPAYPVGLTLERPSLEGLDRAKRIGCQWVTVGVGPADTLGPEGVSSSDGGIGAYLDKAQAMNILVTVQLRPERISPSQLAQYPFIEAKGFADMGHPDTKALFVNHVAAVAPILAGHPAVGAVELIADPYFQFDDEAVRQRFIQHVRAVYPDRINLNRQWHSHLAAYEEITLKGEFEYSFQNKRAFQYDWQTFHQALAQEHLAWAEAEVRRVAPGLPLYVTFRGNVFTEAAARHEPHREAAARQFSASGVTGSVAPSHDIYALSYPGPVALAVFTRAITPEKPVLMPDFMLGGEQPTFSPAFNFTHAALWELYVAGVDGVALSEQSPLLMEPSALEAILTTRSELAAWAPVVRAFQQAPAEVGILFSNTSKIFDDGKPHLESAQFAYEGASFSGYKVSFLTESHIKAGALNGLPVLIIPDTPALGDETFKLVGEHAQTGAAMARTGKPIPYNEYGVSRHDVVRNTGNTVLVRGLNLPTEYLHAMDALIDRGALPRIPRPTNAYGFPLEGVKSRYVEVDGQPYLYLVNLRKVGIEVYLAGSMQTGRDMLRQANVAFPRRVEPLEPMLIALDKVSHSVVVTEAPAE